MDWNAATMSVFAVVMGVCADTCSVFIKRSTEDSRRQNSKARGCVRKVCFLLDFREARVLDQYKEGDCSRIRSQVSSLYSHGVGKQTEAGGDSINGRGSPADCK